MALTSFVEPHFGADRASVRNPRCGYRVITTAAFVAARSAPDSSRRSTQARRPTERRRLNKARSEHGATQTSEFVGARKCRLGIRHECENWDAHRTKLTPERERGQMGTPVAPERLPSPTKQKFWWK